MMLKRQLRVLFNRVFRRKQINLRIDKAVIDVVNNTAELHMDHPAFMEVIASCTEIFSKSGAPNYLELKFFSAIDMRDYVVLIRPESGISPAAINDRLRYALEQIQAGADNPVGVASLALSNCGYTEPMPAEAIQYLRNYFPFISGQGLTPLADGEN